MKKISSTAQNPNFRLARLGNLYIIRLNIIIIVCFISSCNRQDSVNSEVLIWKNNVLQGDISSYEKLSSYYFEKSIDSLLPFSEIMANEFNYTRAYYDVFEIIYLSKSEECVDYNLDCLDDKERKIALNYLIKAIKQGDKTASFVLLEYYNFDKSYPIKELYENSELISLAKLVTQLSSKHPMSQ